VIDALIAKGLPAVSCADADAIVAELSPRLRSGDVVAILSNGGFGGIYEKLPSELKRTSGPA
jgi:UDP-N-acetylmuramate: L-alanyl-gamma-D-glutamyl-meso-diaminopimelate ligase